MPLSTYARQSLRLGLQLLLAWAPFLPEEVQGRSEGSAGEWTAPADACGFVFGLAARGLSTLRNQSAPLSCPDQPSSLRASLRSRSSGLVCVNPESVDNHNCFVEAG